MNGWVQQFADDDGLSHYRWKKSVERYGNLSEKEVLALFVQRLEAVHKSSQDVSSAVTVQK